MAQLGSRREALITWGKRALVIAGALLAVAAVVLAAIGTYAHFQPTEAPDAALSYTGFLDDLQSHGATVQEDEQGGPGQSLPSTAHIVTVNGSKITVYAYLTTHDAERDMARISPDGSTISDVDSSGTGSVVVIDYIAPPHWFHEGRVVVLYVGCDDTLLALLQQVLGPPFAGDSGEIGC